MSREQTALAGIAAMTLVESLMIHLEEAGVLKEGEREHIFDIAIDAHTEANHEDRSSPHRAVAALLRIVRDRSDGVSVVGRMSAK